MSEEVDLDFEFEKEELSSFLDNFADKLEEGEVGISSDGEQKIEIDPEGTCELHLIHHETESRKRLTMEVTLDQSMEPEDDDQPRKKIPVKVV
jgi:amphi-Trp domain-containing protein